MRDVERSSLHLLQQLAEVVVIKRQSADQQRVQDDAARPDVRPPAVILLTLTKQRDGVDWSASGMGRTSRKIQGIVFRSD